MLYRTYQSRSLARRIADSGEPDRLSRHRGVVQSINGDGTVNLTLDGSTLTLSSIPRLKSARINVDDTVETIIDENDVFIIGKLADEDENGIVLDNSQDMIRFHGTGGPMGLLWRGDAAEDAWEIQLVYRTTPNTLGVENALGEAIMEWDTDARTTRAFGGITIDGVITMNGDQLNIVHENPQLMFQDTNTNERYWFHHQGHLFYLLPDRNSDGSWETPYPFRVDATANSFRFWHGATTTDINADGNVLVGNNLYIQGTLFANYAGGIVLNNVNEIYAAVGGENDPSYTFEGNTQTGFYLNSGHMSFTYNATRIFHVSGGVITGIGDNLHTLGNSSNRWKSVWAVDGTINTSDAEQKEDIVDSDLGLNFIRALRPRKNRRAGGTRPHYSLVAQEVKQTLDNMGIDFAGYIDPAVTFMEDEYTEGIFEVPGPLGLRYDEFVSPIIKAIQEIDDRVTALESPRP